MDPYDPKLDRTLNRTLGLLEDLAGQSDRGAAIIGLAWVEEPLLNAIRRALISEKAVWDKLFLESRPLASFSAKVDLARLLGIVGPESYADLHILRKIRNDFAHSLLSATDSPLGFSSAQIANRCANLKRIAEEKLAEPRHQFLRACAVIGSDLELYSSGARASEPDPMFKLP